MLCLKICWRKTKSVRAWVILLSPVHFFSHDFVCINKGQRPELTHCTSLVQRLISPVWCSFTFSHVESAPCGGVCFCSPLFQFSFSRRHHLSAPILSSPASPAWPQFFQSACVDIPASGIGRHSFIRRYAGSPLRVPASVLHAVTNMALNTQWVIDEPTTRLWARQ